jgi:hypothetical protein
MHGAGWAYTDTGSFAALLAHHWYRYAFPLPYKDMDASCSWPEVIFMVEGASQYAILATRAFIGVDHQ